LPARMYSNCRGPGPKRSAGVRTKQALNWLLHHAPSRRRHLLAPFGGSSATERNLLLVPVILQRAEAARAGRACFFAVLYSSRDPYVRRKAAAEMGALVGFRKASSRTTRPPKRPSCLSHYEAISHHSRVQEVILARHDAAAIGAMGGRFHGRRRLTALGGRDPQLALGSGLKRGKRGFREIEGDPNGSR